MHLSEWVFSELERIQAGRVAYAELNRLSLRLQSHVFAVANAHRTSSLGVRPAEKNRLECIARGTETVLPIQLQSNILGAHLEAGFRQ